MDMVWCRSVFMYLISGRQGDTKSHYNYAKGDVPYEDFGIYDCVRFDTFWLDK
jgi:hypothetical protein